MDWYKLKAEAVTEKLNTDAVDGLTATEAVRRLEQYGPNQLEERGATSTWVLIIRQFREIMVIILIIAAVVSALLGELADVIVIMAIVILNAAIGFSQEQ